MSELIDSLKRTGRITFDIPKYIDNKYPFCNYLKKNYEYNKRLNKHNIIYNIPNSLNKVFATNYGGGMFVNNITVDSVIWEERCVSIRKVKFDRDVLSFDFSGCAMAYFQIGVNKYAAHIHLDGSRLDWSKYIQSIMNRKFGTMDSISRFVMFIPNSRKIEIAEQNCKYNRVKYDETNLIGIITPNFECYSVGIIRYIDSLDWDVLYVERYYFPSILNKYEKILDVTKTELELKVLWGDYFYR